MTDVRHIETPLTDDVVRSLHCGDMVSISGVIYTGRDAAHKIMCERIAHGDTDRAVADVEGENALHHAFFSRCAST